MQAAADRLLGRRRSVVVGGVLLSALATRLRLSVWVFIGLGLLELVLQELRDLDGALGAVSLGLGHGRTLRVVGWAKVRHPVSTAQLVTHRVRSVKATRCVIRGVTTRRHRCSALGVPPLTGVRPRPTGRPRSSSRPMIRMLGPGCGCGSGSGCGCG